MLRKLLAIRSCSYRWHLFTTEKEDDHFLFQKPIIFAGAMDVKINKGNVSLLEFNDPVYSRFSGREYIDPSRSVYETFFTMAAYLTQLPLLHGGGFYTFKSNPQTIPGQEQHTKFKEYVGIFSDYDHHRMSTRQRIEFHGSAIGITLNNTFLEMIMNNKFLTRFVLRTLKPEIQPEFVLVKIPTHNQSEVYARSDEVYSKFAHREAVMMKALNLCRGEGVFLVNTIHLKTAIYALSPFSRRDHPIFDLYPGLYNIKYTKHKFVLVEDIVHSHDIDGYDPTVRFMFTSTIERYRNRSVLVQTRAMHGYYKFPLEPCSNTNVSDHNLISDLSTGRNRTAKDLTTEDEVVLSHFVHDTIPFILGYVKFNSPSSLVDSLTNSTDYSEYTFGFLMATELFHNDSERLFTVFFRHIEKLAPDSNLSVLLKHYLSSRYVPTQAIEHIPDGCSDIFQSMVFDHRTEVFRHNMKRIFSHKLSRGDENYRIESHRKSRCRLVLPRIFSSPFSSSSAKSS